MTWPSIEKMFLKERAEAIVLWREDWGEADRRIILLTDRWGKIKATARGEKKLLSKLRGGLGLFGWSEIELVSGRSYPRLTAARPRTVFPGLGEDWRKFVVARKMMSDIEQLMPWHLADESAWLLSLGGLQALHSLNGRYQRLYYYFLWTLVFSWGYQVNLESCAVCHRKLPPKSCHLVSGSGIVCPGCFNQEECAETISANSIKILRMIHQKDKNRLGRIKTSRQDRENLEKITQFFRESVCRDQSFSKEDSSS